MDDIHHEFLAEMTRLVSALTPGDPSEAAEQTYAPLCLRPIRSVLATLQSSWMLGWLAPMSHPKSPPRYRLVGSSAPVTVVKSAR